MARMTGGRIAVRALEDEGMELAFGIPGTHNIELYDALAESERVRTVLVTDEQSASFMADGAWRSSGRMACVNVVPGAGLTHALSGIAEAFMDTVPLLVLGCGVRTDSGMAYQLHDVDQFALVRAVTKGQWRPSSGQEIYDMIREACRMARSGAPGPVFVEVPVNLYLFKHEVALPAAPAGSPGDGPGRGAGGAAGARGVERPDADRRAPAPRVDMAALERAAAHLRAARRPLIHAGLGCLEATGALRALAEKLEAPVSTTFQGKGLIDERHPLFLWCGFGATAPPFVREVVRDCDVTLAVGTRFSEVGSGSYANVPRGPLIHVDIDPQVPGRNFEAEVATSCDAGAFLEALLERLDGVAREPDAELRDDIRRGHAEVFEDWAADVGGERVTPAHLLTTAQAVFGDDTVYATDSGNGTFLAMECLRLSGPRRFLAPVDYSCMGYSVPGALGAALACPDRPVVALAGDGAFLMTGLEMITAASEGVGVVVLVLRDRELAQIAQFQATAMNRRTASRVGEYDVRHLALGTGCEFLALERDDQVESVLAEARKLARGGLSVLVDVAIDYSRKTFFTRGVVKTNLHRLPLKDRLRFIGRAAVRRVTG
jgi:acetolactate synthase-1/2/3 large subunit